MDLASHLGMSLQEVQRKTSSTELLLWCEYLRIKKEEDFLSRDKSEYYYANILAEIRRTLVKHPNKVKWRNFLLEFDLEKPPELSPSERMKNSKNAWDGILGSFEKKKE